MDQPQPLAKTGLIGVVLAGGSSRRFGTDKSTHAIDGVEMRVRVGLTLKSVARDVVLSASQAVCLREGSRPVSESWPFSACVEDLLEDGGPLAGLHAAMTHFAAAAGPTSRILVAPCDMPWITPASLTRLVAATSDEGCDAAVAECGGRLTGVVGCYQMRLLAKLEAFLDEGRSVERFVRSLDLWTPVALTASECRNVNSQEDIRSH